MITLKEIKEKLHADTYSMKADTHSPNGKIVTVRRGFFYRMGKTTKDFENQIKMVFPTAMILDSGEIWKDFRGGATVANSSHWFVKFTIPE